MVITEVFSQVSCPVGFTGFSGTGTPVGEEFLTNACPGIPRSTGDSGTGSLQADVLRRRISWRKEERLFPGSEVRGTAFVYCKEVLELLPH